DDWQSIYSFLMSSATDFLSYRDGAKVYILQQTYRFGQQIVDLAAKVTNRIAVQQRKNVIPKPGARHDIKSIYEFNPQEIDLGRGQGTAMLLHRHVAGCREIGARLIREGLPFWNERGANPLARSADCKAYLAFKKAHQTGEIDYLDLMSLLQVVPSRKMTPEGVVQLVNYGAKKKAKEIAVQTAKPYSMDDLSTVFSDLFLKSIKCGDMSWVDIEYADYYETLSKKGFDLVNAEPKIVVTTIHGAKGREADLVGLFTEAFPRVLESEDEHRIGYVGVTRTRKDLWLIRDQLVGNWTQEYPYPI
ncbi:MAG: 3'-5' exonuclease, partial [Methylocella sp.]